MSVKTEAASVQLPFDGTLLCLVVVAVQCGVQPFLAKACVPLGVATSSLVLSTEVVKVVVCLSVLCSDAAGRAAFRAWSVRSALTAAGIPSVTYLVQNYCIQVAYQNLDGVVFNVLNQSKALFTACFAFLIVGRQQSRAQCVSLGLVTVAGALASLPAGADGGGSSARGGDATIGIPCALAAAALSGLGSGVTEWALRRGQRNTFLLSLELSTLGSLLCLAGLLSGLAADSQVCWREGLFARWSPLTLVPVLTQGLSGILVGIITKVAGGVQKVLATICGLILTCILQQLLYDGLPAPSVCISVLLVAVGIYLHASYPPKSAGKARTD